MLQEKILEKLVCFSDEEIDNLNGKNKIDKSIYVNEDSQIVDSHKLLLDNEDISVRKHTRFCKYPLHRHNYIELVYVYGGEMTHYISGQSITIHEGEILLLNQNIWHSIDYCYENDIIFNFIIKPQFFNFMTSMLDEKNEIFHFIQNILFSYQDESEYLIFRTRNNQEIRTQIDSIITCIYQKNQCQLELKLQIGLLLAKLINFSDQIDIYSAKDKNCMLMNKIMLYIKNNYQTASLEEISDQMNIPNYTISKAIKKMTGLTFKQLLQTERLKIVQYYLKNTDMPIAQIMEEVGYENMTYFYKIFKQKYAMTPHVYRAYLESNSG